MLFKINRRLKQQSSTRLCPICTPRKGRHKARGPRGRFVAT